MFSQQLKASLVGAFFSFLFCFPAYAKDFYPPKAKSTRNITVLTVVWLTPEEVNAKCWELIGKPPEGTILGCFDGSTRIIYTPEPESFNDTYTLSILGHETWHALGAQHP